MNYFAVGFGAVALTAVGAVDYLNQASAAGRAPGSFSVAQYIASYGARADAMREARADAAADAERDERRTRGARTYLPDAPEGWTRRAWLDGDNSPLVAPSDDGLTENAPDLLRNLSARSAKASEERRAAQTWVYERDGQMIAIRAEYMPRDDARTLTSAATDTLAALPLTARPEGWDVIGGVAYGRLSEGMGATDFTSVNGTPFSAYEAPMGLHDAVRLHVLSTAPEADLRRILARVDYDGLNSLLSHPLAHVGRNAPAIPPEVAPAAADVLLALHANLLARRGAEAQAWIERAITPENAMKMALNEFTQGWSADNIPALDPGAEPVPSAEAETQGSAIDAFEKMAGSVFGSASGGANATSTAAPSADDASKPRRLTLSGGKSCLEGSASRFCRE
ncbi:hypothetical protein [Roseovarius aquimarinus]|uniref:Uncharacterized protein n=1 Tax=Roseovarius aquimarinus TaxID=1229156 RepID=A0ABW7I3A0_9RHOB